MKKLFLAMLMVTLVGNAQEITCDQREAIIREQVRLAKFEEAFSTWSDRGKCRFTSGQSYADIERMLLGLIGKSDQEERTQYIGYLTAHYDTNDNADPTNNNDNVSKKALLLHKYDAATPDELFAILDRAYKTNKSKLSNPKALQLYFTLYTDRHKSGKHKVSDEDLLAFHDDLSALIRMRMAGADDATSRSYQSLQNGMRAAMKPVVSCAKLTAYYKSGYEKGKDNGEWLETATMSLSSARCTTDSLFEVVSSRWYKVAPNGDSAYQAAMAAMRKNDRKKASELFEVAASYEDDPAEKAKIYHLVASSLASADKKLAYDYIQKTLKTRPEFGKSYLLMAQIFSGASGCAKSPFEEKALNLLAAQTALKAGQVDPSLKVTAEKQAEVFRKNAPTSAEIKAEKMGGKTISFGCWINQSVVIPKS